MYFNVTKSFIKGQYANEDVVVRMEFPDEEAAQYWADKMSMDIRQPYVVVDISIWSPYE